MLYADGTALVFTANDVHTIECILPAEMNKTSRYFEDNELTVNRITTKVMHFGTRQRLCKINVKILHYYIWTLNFIVLGIQSTSG